MEKRWVIVDEDGNIIRTVTPVGVPKFSHEQDLSVGLIAKRLKLTNDLKFIGADYAYFYAMERRASRRCDEIIISYQLRCHGKWQELWKGTFSTGSGKWNINPQHCSYVVRPDVLDEYSCILKNINKKINVLSLDPTSVIARPGCLEFGVHAFATNIGGSCIYHGYQPADVQTDPSWTLAYTDNSELLLQFEIYWRETAVTNCVGGVPVSPNGSGWTILVNDCGGTGTATWWRVPLVTYDYGDTFTDTSLCQENNRVEIWDGSPLTTGGCPAVFPGVRYICVPGYVLCGSVDPVTYTRGRFFEDAINAIIASMDCGDIHVVSDLFEWDPVGDADGYAPGTNYVTGSDNEHNNLIIVQKSDAILPLANTPARIGELAFVDVAKLFLTAYKVYWDLTADGNIRFEHIKHWNSVLSVNDLGGQEVKETLEYEHLKAEIPRRERLRFPEPFLDDFTGADIVYSGPCVNSADDSVKDYTVQVFMTDVYNVQLNGDSLSKLGFLLLAATFDGTNYYVINNGGALTNALIPNAPLSVANLQRDFWTWDRFLIEGNMNEQDVTFDDIQPNIEQQGVNVALCCDILDFNARDGVMTALGEQLGDLPGYVQKSEFDSKTCILTMTLRYSLKDSY